MKTSKILKVALASLLAGQLASAEPVWPPDSFTCYYGKITEQAVQDLQELDLLVVHPGDEGKNLNAAKIEQLRKAGKDKTIVAYVTVGEDDRPPGGPPIVGEDSDGPSYVGKALTPAMAKNGYPSRFLDQRKIVLGDDGFLQFDKHGKPKITKGQDGHPDENGVWGSFYVRADDPAWRERVFSIMDDLNDIGVDGFFLDTVDTASPWGDYGWTSSAMLDFVKVIRERYPDKRIVANRGLFYLSQNDRYAKLIDAVLFESLLTHYNWENEAGDISPWAKWHVIALNNDVIPAQKRSDMHLLVLDYLNPKQEDALNLVQSDRTLLQNTPHSLSFNHPSLKQPGWTPDELLPETAPASWPSLKSITIQEDEPGTLTLEATFSEDIPKEAHPDLRISTRDEIKADGAAELAPAQVSSWTAEGPKLTIRGSGLDKNQNYHVFLRLISRSKTPQSAYGWTDYQSANNELPSQIQELSTASVASGVELKFKADSLVAKTYRAYSVKEGQRTLLKESQTSPILLDHLEVKGVDHVQVVGVSQDDREGYPSLIKTIVRQDVTPPPSPGTVSFSQSDETSTFSWDQADDAKSYRLYVIPKGQEFRLPLLTEETTEEIDNVVPGEYKVFLTAVDGAGNQSRPRPRNSDQSRMSAPFLVYYGHDKSLIPRLCQTELLILESRGWTDQELAQLRANSAKLIGYISPFAWPDWMGPVKWWWGKKVRDPEWNAWWLSPASMGWRRQLNTMWRELRPRVDGLFFDNLDRLEQDKQGLKPFKTFLEGIRKEWPDAHLIGNRGFTHWSSLNRYLDGVLFENLTDQAFSKGDQSWVEGQLETLRNTQVYALDYQTRRVEPEAERLRSLFPRVQYYCAPDEGLQSLS